MESVEPCGRVSVSPGGVAKSTERVCPRFDHLRRIAIMSVSIRCPWALLALAAFGVPVCANADTIPTPVRTFVQAFVGDAGQGAVRATAVPNLYEVRLGDQFVYVTADAKFFLHGDLYETRGQRNLTESSRKEVRRDIVDAIDPRTYIVFEPSEPKHTVTVFTDVDCPYCAKFHLGKV
jgi:thiol:disulfide interchange protein DsbC